jgi:hypothetical protein
MVKDTIFTGATGRALRRYPAEVRELQFWLTCGPDRDPFGIFIAEPESIAPRIGRSVVSIRNSLDTLVGLGFCQWDTDTQFCWVLEMARIQFNAPLKAVDNRCTLARKWYAAAPRNPYLGPWFDRYVTDFHLTKDPHAVDRREWPEAPGPAPPPGAQEAPCTGMSEDLLGSIPGSSDQPTSPLVPPADVVLTGPALEDAFERLWKTYPNAVEKDESRRAFAKLKPTAGLAAELLAAVELQRQGKHWRQGFVPRLPNWIQKKRWQDRVEDAPAMTAKTANTLAAAQRFVNRHRGT